MSASIHRRTTLAAIGAAALGLGGNGRALAQKLSSAKPIRIVVGSPAGALGDILARLVGQKLADATGATAIVDNKPGAAGGIAADAVAKSPPDGHTLLVAVDSLIVVNPAIYSKLPYNPKDLQPVALLGKVTSVLVASPSLGAKNLDDFIRMAKQKPGGISFGTGGIGHSTHVIQELVWNRLGLQLNHVPYKGTSLAMQDLIGGQIGVSLLSVPEAAPQIATGKLVGLASLGPAGKEIFPNLPELKERNPDLDGTAWFGVFAPAATPRDVVAEINAALNKAAEQPDVKKRLADFGMTPQPMAPAAMDALIAQDRARYVPLVKSLGIIVE